LADKLEKKHKGRINIELEPSKGGCFEVTAGNELIYSKLATGQFPEESDMVAEVGKRLG
jgi:selT/selW/selH-like putative selenoprotein